VQATCFTAANTPKEVAAGIEHSDAVMPVLGEPELARAIKPAGGRAGKRLACDCSLNGDRDTVCREAVQRRLIVGYDRHGSVATDTDRMRAIEGPWGTARGCRALAALDASWRGPPLGITGMPGDSFITVVEPGDCMQVHIGNVDTAPRVRPDPERAAEPGQDAAVSGGVARDVGDNRTGMHAATRRTCG
jgi:hypothetical protein